MWTGPRPEMAVCLISNCIRHLTDTNRSDGQMTGQSRPGTRMKKADCLWNGADVDMIVHGETDMQFGYYTTAARDGVDEESGRLDSILRFRCTVSCAWNAKG